MKSIATVERIDDPQKRLKAAADLVRKAHTAAADERPKRDMAVIIAHLDQGVLPAKIYRDPTSGENYMSRGLFNRILRRAPTDTERQRLIAEHPETFTDALASAHTAMRALAEHDAVEKAALKVRDDTVYSLLHGTDGVTPISNATIARIAGLSTARIAQIRTGN